MKIIPSIRLVALPAILLAAAAPGAPAYAQAAPAAVAIPAAAAGHYSVEDTEIGALLDDPAAKAVLDRNMPDFSKNEQIDMARSMTLKSVQQFAPDKVTDTALAAIQTGLNALPSKP